MKIIRYMVAASLLLPLGAALVTPIIAAPAPATPKSAAKGKVITKNDINVILLASDKAANKRDIEAIVAHLAPDFVAKITVPGQSTVTLNLDQYKTVTAQSLALVENYQYKRLSTQIVVAPNGKSARVIATTQESMTINGQQIRGATKSTSIFQVRGNRILVTSMTATSTMSVATEV